jgi:hypothetical protein
MDMPQSQIVYRGIPIFRAEPDRGSRWAAYVPDRDGHRLVEADTAPELLAAIDETLNAQ